MLEKVNEKEILYFRGIFQEDNEEYDTDADLEDDAPMFEVVESRDRKLFADGSFDISFSMGDGYIGKGESPMNTYELFFGVCTLYDLIEEGIAYETVEALIPQLHQYYESVLKPWPKSHRRFQKSWDGMISSFKESRGLR